MKVLIVSYYFHPESTPRAFRAHELVKEFDKRGDEITLVLPNKQIYRKNNFSKNVTVKYVGSIVPESKQSESETNRFVKRIKEILSDVKYYFFPFSFFSGFLSEATKVLIKDNKEYDIVFSNSFPFITHYALHKAMKKNKSLKSSKVKIAEYSDPFYYQKHKKLLFKYKLLEKVVIKDFDFISIPTSIAVDSYLNLKSKEKIKVLPQAYDLDSISIEKYTKNDIPSFAYAGMFYSGMRDPSFLFDYLSSVNQDFRFIIFTRFTDDIFISKYKNKLGEKMTVKTGLGREQIIKELSQMDFLINIENVSENQKPSKLIDYAISKRPIFSASKSTFSKPLFNNFLEGNYESQYNIDLNNHNIVNIVDEIKRLVKND